MSFVLCIVRKKEFSLLKPLKSPKFIKVFLVWDFRHRRISDFRRIEEAKILRKLVVS